MEIGEKKVRYGLIYHDIVDAIGVCFGVCFLFVCFCFVFAECSCA